MAAAEAEVFRTENETNSVTVFFQNFPRSVARRIVENDDIYIFKGLLRKRMNAGFNAVGVVPCDDGGYDSMSGIFQSNQRPT